MQPARARSGAATRIGPRGPEFRLTRYSRACSSPDRAFGSGPKGSRFDSCQAHHPDRWQNARIAKQYRLATGARIPNGVITLAAAAGLGPKALHQVTVRGRKTGRTYSTPILVVESAGGRYWVAVYGDTNTVQNARAAGRLTLRRGRVQKEVRLTEIPVAERVPYLRARAALGVSPMVRPYFDVTPQTPDAELAAIAADHTVFKLEPA